MRVSVTITEEMNQYFKNLAEQKGTSKDKIIGDILKKAIQPNQRGAGRKTLFSNEEIQEIIKCRQEGQSYQKIANTYKCSIGLIHKLINEEVQNEI